MSGMTPQGWWPSVSLVMPNRDNATVLDLVLTQLTAHTQYPDVELVAVDDGSTDGSREILRRWRTSKRFGGDFHVVEHEHTDGGVVDALNAGLDVARGELVVQLDADASIETSDWLRRMVTFFVSDDRIGLVTARVVMDSGELQACGIHVVTPEGYHDRGCEITETIGSRTSNHKVRRFYEAEWPASRQLAEVDGGMGVCMMYRREAALAVGGYDRGFAPVWLDDLDLSISLRRAGLKVFYLPDVRAVHHLGRRARPDDRGSAPGRTRTAAGDLRHAAAAVLPREVRSSLVRALRWDRGPRSYRRAVARHYRYWRKKWGWDLLNPDLAAIQRRWGTTELCWRNNPEMRRAGERIIVAFESATDRDGAQADPGR
jgi:GT2 family glycosyltransferase